MVAAQGLAWRLLVWAALGLGGAAEPCEGQRRERVGAPEGGGSFVVAALACGLLLALAYGALQAVVKADEDKDEDKEEEEEEGGEQVGARGRGSWGRSSPSPLCVHAPAPYPCLHPPLPGLPCPSPCPPRLSPQAGALGHCSALPGAGGPGCQALANVEHDLRAFLAELRRHQGRAPDQGRGAAGWDLDRLHVTVYELEPE